MNDDEARIKAAFGQLDLPEPPERLRRRLAALAVARPTRDRAWRPWASAGAIAAAAVALLLVGLAVLGPGGTPTPTPTAAPGGLTRYDTGMFSFSYPAAWRTFEYHVDSSFSHSLVYLATVDVPEPCETTQASGFTRVDCQDRWSLGLGGVVVVVSANGRPGFDIANVPAGAGTLTVDGQPGYLEKGTAPTGDPTWTWTFARPGTPDNFFTIRATFRGPDAGTISAELFALVATIQFDTRVSPVPPPNPSPMTVCHPVPPYYKGVFSPFLTCASAVAAALAALPADHPAIARIEFQFGDYCPGGCSGLNLLDGYVIVTFVDGPALLLSVRDESPTSGVHVTSVGPLAPQPGPTANADGAPNSVDATGGFGGGGLWATRSGSLYISSDGGRSWKVAPSAFTTPGACIDSGIGCGAPFVLDARHAWIINAGPGSTEFTGSQTDVLKLVLVRTTDGGTTWRQISIPGSYPGTTQSLVFVDADHGFLLCGWTRMSPTPSTVLRTDDGGLTWRVVYVGSPGGDTASLGSMFAASSASTLWAGAEGDAGPIGRALFDVSHDAGTTWSPVDLPGLTGQLGGALNYLMAPPTFAPVSLVTVVSGTESGNVTRIYRSADGGADWSLASSLQREASANLLALDATHWLLPVSNSEGLTATADGGKTWQDLATVGLTSNWIVSMAAASSRDLIAVVATGTSQPGPQALFVSHDGGLTWAPMAHG
jgi:hypothetical protein